MPAPMTGVLMLVLLVGSLAGLFLARLRLERERRRADAAESRSRSYFSVIEILARSLREGIAGWGDRDRLLEEARRQGLSEEELRALNQGMAKAGGAPAGRSTADTRYLFISFEEEIRRASSRGEPLTLLTLEADSPTAAGRPTEPAVTDRILRGVAHAVRRQMRGCDTCVRYGAREFILILPGVSREEARQVEKRIRTAVQAIRIESPEGTEHPLLAGMGSATFPVDGGGFDALLTVADLRRSRGASPDSSEGGEDSRAASLPWLPRSVSPN